MATTATKQISIAYENVVARIDKLEVHMRTYFDAPLDVKVGRLPVHGMDYEEICGRIEELVHIKIGMEAAAN
jgi:hypothetical protein